MAEWNAYYRSRYVLDPQRSGVWKEICRYLQKRYIPKESSILEIGAGYCHFINHIEGGEKRAFDVSDELFRYADRSVKAEVGSCLSLTGVDDQYFDVVFASNLFEHLSRNELTVALSEIHRVLRQDGKLVVIQPNFKYCVREYFDDYTHVQVFTHIGFTDLLRASGYRVVDVKPRFLPFSMKSRLPKVGWLVRLYLMAPLKPFAAQMLVVAEKYLRGSDEDVE